MHGDGPLDFLPVGALFIATLLVGLVSVECGYRLGRQRRQGADRDTDAPIGEMVAATLALLAFLLAFTFGMAAERYDVRRHLVLDDANAIGTTYLRATLLPEHRDEIRALLREYVDLRLDAFQSKEIEHALRRSGELQDLLWRHATELGTKHPNSIVVGLFIQSLNDMIDLHAKRVEMGMRNPIPAAIWGALYTVAILSLAAMGYHGGLVGSRRPLVVLAVTIAFSVVLWLIADLDRPREGTLQVSQEALIDLQKSMKESSP